MDATAAVELHFSNIPSARLRVRSKRYPTSLHQQRMPAVVAILPMLWEELSKQLCSVPNSILGGIFHNCGMVNPLGSNGRPMRSACSPPCPICGNLNPERLSDEPVNVQCFTQRLTRPNEIYHRFRCSCGADFVRGFNDDDQSNWIAENGKESPPLVAEAERLEREIGRLLDDPNRQIVGFEGEAYIAQIRCLARQCEAEGLRQAADQLDQLGRAVMRRWAD